MDEPTSITVTIDQLAERLSPSTHIGFSPSRASGSGRQSTDADGLWPPAGTPAGPWMPLVERNSPIGQSHRAAMDIPITHKESP
jgi:hypothetical protein